VLYLDIFVPRVFRVQIEVIIVDGELTTEVIPDVWGSRPACFVYGDRPNGLAGFYGEGIDRGR